MKKFLIIMLLILASVSVVTAQEEETATVDDYLQRYEGLTTERLEDGGFVVGSPDAPLTVVEFADFLCPHCQDYTEVAHQFVESYVAEGQARFEYRLFPVVDPVLSAYSSQVAECADVLSPGLFFPVHDYLFDKAAARELGPEIGEVVAEFFSLDADELTTCAETAEQYLVDLELGSSVGVSGTPATRIRVEGGELGYAMIEGQPFDRGGLPFEILEMIVTAENPAEMVLVPGEFSMLTGLIEPDEACEDVAPCWNGWVPGESLWADFAIYIESENNFTGVQRLSTDDPNSTVEGITWQVLGTSNPSQGVTVDGETLEYVILSEETGFTVGEVVEAQGDPTYAVATLQGGFAIVDVFYVDQSMIIQVLVESDDSGDLVFTEDAAVIGAQIVAPALLDEALAQREFPEWAGFGDLADYALE